MFTRAGFNARHRSVCHALVWVGSGRAVWAELIRFSSGDLCWYSRVGLCWNADPHNMFRLPLDMERVRWSWPSSRLPR